MSIRSFASDNNSGVHPAVLNAIIEANSGHCIGYGDDLYTRKAEELFKNEFGDDIAIFFVLTGTGANILSLKSMSSSFHSIFCTETAHINVDECGAPEKFTGSKLIGIPSDNGKISLDELKKRVHGFGFEHHSQPGVISISQVTELGTVYTVNEIKEIAEFAHSNGMYLHMDGARIANAAVSLNLSFREFTKDAGVEILSFGGTKNGMMLGEAVVIFNQDLAIDTKYYRKQAAQLYSKMRFVSAQFIPYLEQELWKTNATHSNRMARKLEQLLRPIKGIAFTQPVEANGLFVKLPAQIIPVIQEEYFFYVWNEHESEVRFMTSFDTTEDDIQAFATLIRNCLS